MFPILYRAPYPLEHNSYLLQHLRFNRGQTQVMGNHWRHILYNKKIPLLRKIDVIIFSLGYSDRPFFFIAFILTFLSLFVLSSFHFPLWIWFFILGPPAFEILIALIAEKERISMYFRLPLILSMFSLDIFVTLKAFYQDLTKKPNRWYKTPRVGDSPKTPEQDSISQSHS